MPSDANATGRKVLLIGWDAADWKVITPLLDGGEMPHLERLINGGVIGNISTLYPILSPMLWTSIATGKRAFKHGICGFIEPDPHGGGMRPITNLSRKTKAVWNILNQNGKKCNVIGWWPSHPAEPLDGVMVSNHFQQAVGDVDKPWPITRGSVHPARLMPHLAKLRIHPAELEAEHLLPFVPRAAEIDQTKDRRLYMLAKILAECSTVHAVGTAVMQLEPWDFMAVYYDAIDHFSHGFMRYHPPRLEWVPQEDFDFYNDVIRGAYGFHDMMLGTLLKLAGDETTVILMSDHGFLSDHLRPASLPTEAVGPAAEHRPQGIFVMRGPGIRRDERVYGTTLLDVTPTILQLFDLPVGRDMDGRVTAGAWEELPQVRSIDSWDAVEGPSSSGQHPLDLRIDPVEAREAIRQLVALGYIAQPPENQAAAAAEAARELNFHLAQAYVDAQQHAAGVVILCQLWDEWPEELRFGVRLLHCYVALERPREARQTLERLKTAKAQYSVKSAAEAEQFREKHKDVDPKDLPQWKKAILRRLVARAATNLPAIAYLEACVLELEQRYEEAFERLKEARRPEPGRMIHLMLKQGDLLFKMRRGAEAENRYRAVLKLDPQNPSAHLGICRRHLRRRKYDLAAESAREALGAMFYNPKAHYYHGLALRDLGEVDLAIRAFQTALAQNPNFPRAHAQLSMIYKRRLKNDTLARQHREAATRVRQFIRQQRQSPLAARPTNGEGATVEADGAGDVRRTELRVARDQWIVVVSGLPRSGTSMMMQMLAAGGVPILCDQVRKSDESNPRGYFEFEKVKSLRHDASWLNEALGKAVKVVAQLVPFLPRDFHYKFIFMDRELDEVMHSQGTMLDAMGRSDAKSDPSAVRTTYRKQLGQARTIAAANPQAEVLTVAHRDVVKSPEAVARRVAEFLGFANLDINAMASIVDPQLYRARNSTSGAASSPKT